MLAFLEPAIAPVLFTSLAALLLWQFGHWSLVMAILNQTWENLWSADTIQVELREAKIAERTRLIEQKRDLLGSEDRAALAQIDTKLRELDFWLTKDFFTSLHPRSDSHSIHSSLDDLNKEVEKQLVVFSQPESRISESGGLNLRRCLTGTAAGLWRPESLSLKASGSSWSPTRSPAPSLPGY